MVKRRMAIIALLISFCFLLLPCYATAASTADASEPINLRKDCTLTLSYACNGTAFEDITVNLYKIATVSEDFQYTLTTRFDSTKLILNGVKTNGEWNVIRSTLEARIVADSIAADNVVKTDSKGLVCFENLKPALYLAVVGTTSKDALSCRFESALIALPNLNTDGSWQYQVDVVTKSEIIPPSQQEVELKVLKLWKGDKESSNRPKNIEVEIFRDGTSYKKVVLSNDNNWSYSWKTNEDGAKWTVIERNTPEGYTMTLEDRDNAFVLTNTYVPENPDLPPDIPQTGDTFNFSLYVILMIASGCLLIILGIVGKRK